MKGERRGKRKLHFRLDYAKPHSIFTETKILKIDNPISRFNEIK